MCVKQPYSPTEGILAMMETFGQMVNYCLNIGLADDVSTMKKLSKLCYPSLASYDIYSKYKLHAISKAAGILATRKKSMRRGYPTKEPYMRKLCLVSSYGFKIEEWVGIPTIPLTKKGTRGASSLCPRCGERLQVGTMKRMLYCPKCKHEMDRDVVAAMNMAYKGRSRFERSQGAAGEAMKGNVEKEPLILRVHAAKLTFRRKPAS